jgi:hypothetical protein
MNQMPDQHIRDAIDEIASRSGEPDNRPPNHSRATERVVGLLFFLGPVLALIGIIYLLGFLGD